MRLRVLLVCVLASSSFFLFLLLFPIVAFSFLLCLFPFPSHAPHHSVLACVRRSSSFFVFVSLVSSLCPLPTVTPSCRPRLSPGSPARHPATSSFAPLSPPCLRPTRLHFVLCCSASHFAPLCSFPVRLRRRGLTTSFLATPCAFCFCFVGSSEVHTSRGALTCFSASFDILFFLCVFLCCVLSGRLAAAPGSILLCVSPSRFVAFFFSISGSSSFPSVRLVYLAAFTRIRHAHHRPVRCFPPSTAYAHWRFFGLYFLHATPPSFFSFLFRLCVSPSAFVGATCASAKSLRLCVRVCVGVCVICCHAVVGRPFFTSPFRRPLRAWFFAPGEPSVRRSPPPRPPHSPRPVWPRACGPRVARFSRGLSPPPFYLTFRLCSAHLAPLNSGRPLTHAHAHVCETRTSAQITTLHLAGAIRHFSLSRHRRHTAASTSQGPKRNSNPRAASVALQRTLSTHRECFRVLDTVLLPPFFVFLCCLVRPRVSKRRAGDLFLRSSLALPLSWLLSAPLRVHRRRRNACSSFSSSVGFCSLRLPRLFHSSSSFLLLSVSLGFRPALLASSRSVFLVVLHLSDVVNCSQSAALTHKHTHVHAT